MFRGPCHCKNKERKVTEHITRAMCTEIGHNDQPLALPEMGSKII